jgi:hypothetical protein
VVVSGTWGGAGGGVLRRGVETGVGYLLLFCFFHSSLRSLPTLLSLRVSFGDIVVVQEVIMKLTSVVFAVLAVGLGGVDADDTGEPFSFVFLNSFAVCVDYIRRFLFPFHSPFAFAFGFLVVGSGFWVLGSS